MTQKKPGTQEILIIRRGGGDDNAAHKGGAWKIAYADFVTAMMAFFLVMWLINSANEVTKARVASYFNPIKMTDASPAKRGLKEEIDAQSPNNRADDPKKGGGDLKKPQENGKPSSALAISDNQLLMNPYAALDELAKVASDETPAGALSEDIATVGDPFNPRAFEHIETTHPVASAGDSKDSQGQSGASHPAADVPDVKSKQESPSPADGLADPAIAASEKETNKSVAESAHKGQTMDSNAKALSNPEGDASESAASRKQFEKEEQLAQQLSEKIEQKIADSNGKIGLRARVTMTDEGLLVVLEDGDGSSMFSIGSAQPNPALVEIIAEIGSLLATADGDVIVRGHTDSRQFRNQKYDNWQLSTDRAHMASYMLVRGGLSEQRLKRIEGYGSSTPVVPGNTLLDANRRVEFLLAK